jgi:hypothetical protein
MGFNESRFWMVAPNWEPTIEVTTALTGDGRNVKLLSFRRRSSPEGKHIGLNELRRWFLDQEFTPDARDEFALNWNGLEAIIEDTDDDVGSLRLTFKIFDIRTLQIVAQLYASEWEALVIKLSDVWGFQLLKPGVPRPMAASDFMVALRRTPACENIPL